MDLSFSEPNVDLAGKTILLTGGTGSFGSAFVKRVLRRWPDVTIRVFSRDEFKQSLMRNEYGQDNLRYLIGDVRDRYRFFRACQGVDYVVHAAAMKQVSACEYNPSEAIQTNVAGAQNLVDAAIDAGVPRVVALSTDKAVNPVNLYGATKLCAEKIFVQGNAYAAGRATQFSCVRYGNVLGSRGSVVPLFRAQAEQGMLTITDERMTRFWITLEQAVDLVLFAMADAQPGEIFVPKIPSVRVVDLAAAIAPDVPWKTIGVQPGEKLHEMLLTADECRHAYESGDLYIVRPDDHPWRTELPVGNGWKPVPKGFSYRSDTNDRWLSPGELREWLS